MVEIETNWYKNLIVWINSESYFYGTIISAGGKKYPTIKLVIEDDKVLRIHTNQEYLAEHKNNILYKTYCVRAAYKQRLDTAEIKNDSLRLIELIEYNPTYDENYITNLREKGRKAWEDITDPVLWVRQLRGGDDE